MKEITVWEAWCPKDKIFKHNHIEDGWAKGNTPKAVTVQQARAWMKKKFKKSYGYLTKDFVVKGVRDVTVRDF